MSFQLLKTEFVQIMKNLPIPVSDDEIEEMFAVVDKNGDEKISYREFQKMINPPDLPLLTKPHITQIGLIPQTFSPPSGLNSINYNILIFYQLFNEQ